MMKFRNNIKYMYDIENQPSLDRQKQIEEKCAGYAEYLMLIFLAYTLIMNL